RRRLGRDPHARGAQAAPRARGGGCRPPRRQRGLPRRRHRALRMQHRLAPPPRPTRGLEDHGAPPSLGIFSPRKEHAMAAPRSSWKGYLRVSLVSCPVRLYPGSSSADKISFNNLAPGSMSRIQMVPTDPTTGKAVPREELLKGYEFEKGRYVIVSDEELD